MATRQWAQRPPRQAGEPQLSAWRESQAAQVRGAQAEPSGLPKVSRVGLGTHAILGRETRRGSPPSPAASQSAQVCVETQELMAPASGTGARGAASARGAGFSPAARAEICLKASNCFQVA